MTEKMEIIVRIFQKCSLVALLVVSHVSFASSAYKTVGPNGEISYSSTPPQTSKAVTKIDMGGAMVVTDEGDPKKAAAMVIAMSRVVNLMSNYCRANVPDTTRENNEAQTQWNTRNAKLVSAANRVMNSNLSSADQNFVYSLIGRLEQILVGAISRAPKDKQLKLCIDAPQRYNDYKINLIDHGKLVNTLFSYK
jgi:hypothetical protein